MRFKSKVVGGFQVFAVAGVNTVSFGITATAAAKPGLLGFGVKRGRKGKQLTTMRGFKVFKSIIPKPTEKTEVSTFDHPVQSFVWDDFTAQPDTVYDYEFHPFRGTPANLDRTAAPIPIRIQTEELFSKQEHDVFFNRGVASSQAYARKFGNKRPDKQPTAKKREEALQWLTRELDEAALAFIKQAKSGDMLLCCFYEFRYRLVADELKAAIGRGVDVRIIIDAKVNEFTDKHGFHKSFPREDNLAMIDEAKIPIAKVTLREAKPNNIAHNKFMVLLTGPQRTPTEVWTGSTNISLSGFSGQTNVGHWLRNATVAKKYRDYWDLLRGDPGPKAGDSPSDVRHANADFRADVEAIFDVPTSIANIPKGVLPVFSPRSGSAVLDEYVKMVDTADEFSCITLAFGINKAFKEQLKDNTTNSHLIFMLLEKPDAPTTKNKATFVKINASNNVYKASGAFIRDPVYQFVKESYPKAMGIAQHVSYVHSKFLLMDPLSKDPIVVTGSANFSDDSTNDNDENMLIIRGEQRVADIYFTEFNRLFNHYYFRAVYEALKKAKKATADESAFLRETDDWLDKYKKGKLRAKRVNIYAKMEGFTSL